MTAGPRGVYCPIITPLNKEEELDEEVLTAQLARLDGQVDGLMLLGTTGELPLLAPTVADRLVDTVLAQAGHTMPIMLGVSGAGTTHAHRNLRRVRPGVDYVSACSPYYYPAPPDAMTAYFLDIAEASPVPLVLYNIPQNTHQVIPLDVVASLSGHDNITGIKDSSGDIAYFQALIHLANPTFTVLQGTDEVQASTYYRMGADGYVSGLENLIPGSMKALARALSAHDAPALAHAEATIASAAQLTRHGFWLSALKAAVGLLVGGSGTSAGPLPPPTPAELGAIRDGLTALGLLPRAAQQSPPTKDSVVRPGPPAIP